VRYALRDGEHMIDGPSPTWYLYLDARGGRPHVGDWPLEETEKRNWWRVPSHVLFDPEHPDVEIETSGGRRVVGYRRNVDANDRNLPETLSVGEYDERTDDDGDAYDRRVAPLYDAEYEDNPVERAPVEGDWLVLQGAPPPADGREWVGTLPTELSYSPEYRHLFPGRLEGFRKALVAVLSELPGVDAYDHRKPTVSVYVKVDLPRLTVVEFEKRPSLAGLTKGEKTRLRASLERPVSTIAKHLEIPAPHYIPGSNRAAACVAWDAQMGHYVAHVRAILASPCPTCQGHGFLLPLPDGCTGSYDEQGFLSHDGDSCPVHEA
jgi:hypothetical protein